MLSALISQTAVFFFPPFCSIMGDPYMGECAVKGAHVSFFEDTSFQGGTDMWGVPYAAPSAGIEAAMPDTRINILEEISDWTKVIKFPEPLSVDLDEDEACCCGECEDEA